MRLRTLGLAALLPLALTQDSDAIVRPKGAEAPLVSHGLAPRTHRSITWSHAGTLPNLPGWVAQWDYDTNVPLRMWGPSIPVTNAMTDAGAAEAAARAFLAQHIALLAPGASPSDFVLVSNVLDGTGSVRSVGFAQHKNGVAVLGGSIGFGFKNDRLALVSSTALPNVAATVPATRIAPAQLQRNAVRWLAGAGQTVDVMATTDLAASQPLIVPVVRPRLPGKAPVIQYRVAEQVRVQSSTNEGRWDVWLDATDGTPIARKTLISYVNTATVNFNVPDQRPTSTRSPHPASNLKFTIDGTASTASVDGSVTWATAQGSANLVVNGKFVQVLNKSGANLTETVTLPAGQQFTWNKATNEQQDAQLDSYIFAEQAKQFARNKLNPTADTLTWLNGVIQVNVNENQTCNAFSTGDDVHFFVSDNQCENTGRISDVVYHEFGHSLHANSIIQGVGAFDGSLSEGLADTNAEAITGDSGMGRGFFKQMPDSPLRELNPTVKKKFPQDMDGEPHDEGEIIGEALWDTRQALETKYGQAAGYAKWLPVEYAMFQRAHDIPSTFAEALLANDDDGDLSNGTPDQCEITAAFGAHGLADPTATLGIKNPTRDSFTVSMQVAGGSSSCASAQIMSTTLNWQIKGQAAQPAIAMTQAADTFTGVIPTQPDGSTVQYSVTVTMSDNSTIVFPNNPAYPFYEFFVGEVTKLYCNDFESGTADGWTLSPDFEVGAPQGLSTDPKVAVSGTNALGIDLGLGGGDGTYQSNHMSVAETPAVDLAGNTAVHLQYQRWLGVEDGFYDHANIVANGMQVFSNFASQTDPAQTIEINHIDKEWQFHDVDLTAAAKASTDGKIKVDFQLMSDPGLEFGGWTLDDVCIVALSGAAVTCGNGVVDAGETCDDGNRTSGDGCDMNCQTEDDGGKKGGGCCSTGTGAAGPIALSLLTLGLVTFRRRRR